MPDTGVSNITAEPKLASPSHLSAGSPCLGAGTAAHVSGVDIDGEPWSNPPPMGCDQFNASATGPLAVSIHPEFTTVAKGFALNLVGDIRGNCNASVWDFADGNILSNRPFASHAWATAGDFSVVLRAFNSSFPAGISATQLIHVVDGFYYVSLSSTNPVSPFTSWGTAATNIQDAADVAAVGGTVLVTNGVYRNGGRVAYPGMTNRLVINKTITVRSVNGPSVTAIEGHQNPTNILGDDAIRCVYMTNRATLSGFMLTNGASLLDGNEAFDYNLYTGGGVYSESAAEVVTNCVIVNCASSDYGGGAEQGTLIDSILRGNSCLNGGTGGGADAATLNHCSLFSNWSTQNGGGVSRSTLNRCLLTNNASTNGGATAFSTVNNCLLVGNTAIWGGGDYGSIMYNCTIVSNSAQIGGGGNGSVLYNCIAYDNSAPDGTNYAYGIQRYSCTTPWPGGSGNFTNAPLFVNEAGGNFRLQSNSPCINASANALAPSGPDLDGNPRIAGTTVDVGAYEFQSPTSVIAYWWLQQYGLPLDGSIDFNDPDHDGMNNWQESLADTNPTNTLSVLKLLPLAATNNSAGIVVTWQSIGTRTYFLQRSTNLPTFQTLATDIGGQDGTTSYTDETAVGLGPFFYRVGVQ